MHQKMALLIICTLLGNACATLTARFGSPQGHIPNSRTWKYSPVDVLNRDSIARGFEPSYKPNSPIKYIQMNKGQEIRRAIPTQEFTGGDWYSHSTHLNQQNAMTIKDNLAMPFSPRKLVTLRLKRPLEFRETIAGGNKFGKGGGIQMEPSVKINRDNWKDYFDIIDDKDIF